MSAPGPQTRSESAFRSADGLPIGHEWNSRGKGLYSRPVTLGGLDRRTRESRFALQLREELVGHLGREPSVVERRLVDRAAMLALRLALADAKAPEQALTEGQLDEYIRLHNAYVRVLQALGLRPPPAPAPSLADHLAMRAAERAAAAEREEDDGAEA